MKFILYLSENLALHKPSNQSSTLTDQHGKTYIASWGNDGIINEEYHFTHTLKEETPYWMVDLREIANISKIKVYFRTDCCRGRNQNVRIWLKNPTGNWALLKHYPGAPIYEIIEISIPKRKIVRYVKI